MQAFSSDYVSAAHSSAALVIVNWWYRAENFRMVDIRINA